MSVFTASPAPYFIILCTSLTLVLQSAHPDPQLPCYFVFGDSLSDNGNNNALPTFARANYYPYGVDSPANQPTGRFNNGRSIVDVISGHLGFDEPAPPFASTSAMDVVDLLKGVNYASGAAGIRPETGQHLGARIPLDQQLVNHQNFISRISDVIRNDPSYLSKCLYTINVGSNDYLNNYYYYTPESIYSTSQEYAPKEYAQVLVQQYSQQIKRLYKMGARKVALFTLGELGTTPRAVSFFGPLLANKVSVASALFNEELRKLVDELNSELRDANFTCINMDSIYISAIASAGIVDLTEACCQVRFDGQCVEDSAPCAQRNKYVFFDNFHPTDAMCIRLGDRSYEAAFPFDAHPIDIRTLVQA